MNTGKTLFARIMVFLPWKIQDFGAHHVILWIPAFAGMTFRKQGVFVLAGGQSRQRRAA